MTHTQYDVGIVGGGPAGLSAAILLGRCRRRVVLFDSGEPRNGPAQAINGFLSRDGVSPAELRRLGREQASKYDVTLIDLKVTDAVGREGSGFEITAEDDSVVEVRKILFTTGVKDALPDVPGIANFYGTTVHHCPYCDGWEHRDRRLVALGDGDSVVELSLSLLAWSADVTTCTHGQPLTAQHQEKLARAEISYRCESIERLDGEDGQLTGVSFIEGAPLACDALFFSSSQALCSDLPEKLGCACNSDGLLRHVDKQHSDVKGIFLAGDACSDVQFAIVAAAQGAIAATAINAELHEEDIKAKFRLAE